MKNVVLILGFLFFAHAIVFAAKEVPVTRYNPPPSIELEITSKTDAVPACAVSVSLKSLVGKLTNMSIFFETSPDLEVSPKTSRLDSFVSGTTKTFDVQVKKTGTKPSAGGSWVRARVVYLPDYDGLLKAIAGDKKAYPLELLRNQLLASVGNLKKNTTMDTQSMRFFFPTPKKGQ